MSKKLKIGLIVIAGAFVLSCLSYFLFQKQNYASPSDLGSISASKAYDPPFTKEGELEITDGVSGKVISRLSIEIADNDKETAQGMMYRQSMLDSLGMLFVFEQPDVHYFWMKNTKISLDILFIDKEFNIVHITRSTTPYSENQIPSEKEIMFALEVNAGFCDKKGVKIGDRITYRKSQSVL